jgi:hypothetical protein
MQKMGVGRFSWENPPWRGAAHTCSLRGHREGICLFAVQPDGCDHGAS